MSTRIYPIKKNNRFELIGHQPKESLFLKTIPSFVFSLFNRKNRNVGSHVWHTKAKKIERTYKTRLWWIGHATFLIQIGGYTILTDPIFDSPSFLFPRITPPGIDFENLPPIDFVLLSHNHYDHMDLYSLRLLKKFKRVTFLVPMGDKKWFLKHGFLNVHEFSWWEFFIAGHGLKPPITFTFLPAAHWSRRGLFDLNKSLWGSWMIEANNKRIYFAGDTAYYSHFKMIGQEYGSITAALMPIGPCEPRKSMQHSHIDSFGALDGFIDLNASHFIPMHWGTFSFGLDYFFQPIERLKSVWQKNAHRVSQKILHIMKIGQSVQI